MARNCYCKPVEGFNEDDNIDNESPPEGFNDDRSFTEDDYIDNEPPPEGFNNDRSFTEDDYIDNEPPPEGFNNDRSFTEDDYIDNEPPPEGFNNDRSFTEDDYIDNEPPPEGFNDDRSFTEDDYIENTSPPSGIRNAGKVSGSKSAGSSRSPPETRLQARKQSSRNMRSSNAVTQRAGARAPRSGTRAESWQMGPVIPRSPQKIDPSRHDGSLREQLNIQMAARSHDPLSRLSPSNVDNFIIRRHAGLINNLNGLMNTLQQPTLLLGNGSTPRRRGSTWYPYGP